MEEPIYLQVADFVIFALVLLVSVVVGIIFAYRDRNKESTENYYYGGRKINPVPVAASLAVSFVSAIAIIGLPVEVYLHGTIFAWNTVAQLIATLVAVTWYIPVFQRLRLKSVYEYLELRYNRVVRMMASIVAMINLFLYMGIVIFLPSLALSAVTPINLYVAIALTSVVCTFYTTIGGMKAVIWTDVLQALIMIAGMLGVFIQGVIMVGGIDNLVSAADRQGRRNFLKYVGDPRVRSTIWTVALGLGINACFETGCNQVYIQRYLSCKTVTTARIALILTLIPGFAFTLMCVGNGMVINAYYEGCDPKLSGKVDNIDQSIPRLAVEIFEDLPGMAGLFVSSVYCGTLSSISSGINAMSALVMMDFILPCHPNLTSKIKIIISKCLSFAFGALVMALAYLVSLSTTNIVEIFVSLSGWIGGPMIGIFTMGLFMPWVNQWGALAGFLCSWGIVGWIGITAMISGPLLYEETTRKLPQTMDMCNATTTFATDLFTTTISGVDGSGGSGDHDFTIAPGLLTTSNPNGNEEIPVIYQTLYSISPFLYGVLGFIICVIVGNIISLITGVNKPSEANPKLFMPIINVKIFRFGVPELKDDDKTKVPEMPLEEY